MKKILFIALNALLTSCVGGKDLYYTALPAGTTLASDASQALDHSSFDAQLRKYVNADGLVNYQAWKSEHAQLKSYLDYLNKNAPQNGWSQAEQFAYYINLYNAATVNLILDNDMPASIKDINGPLGQVWLKEVLFVNNKPYSLKAIEGNVLQKMGDPRIHFAINCASFSCPNIQNKAFTATNVNELMEQGASQFINSDKNTLNAQNPELSKIFDWYATDFTDTGVSIIAFINKYAKTPIDENAQLSYKDYNWLLNKQ